MPWPRSKYVRTHCLWTVGAVLYILSTLPICLTACACTVSVHSVYTVVFWLLVISFFTLLACSTLYTASFFTYINAMFVWVLHTLDWLYTLKGYLLLYEWMYTQLKMAFSAVYILTASSGAGHRWADGVCCFFFFTLIIKLLFSLFILTNRFLLATPRKTTMVRETLSLWYWLQFLILCCSSNSCLLMLPLRWTLFPPLHLYCRQCLVLLRQSSARHCQLSRASHYWIIWVGD